MVENKENKEIECIVCGCNDVEDIDYIFLHENSLKNENHYLCKECMETTLVVCTCKKNLNEEPTELMFVCPCDSQKNVYTNIYIDINNNVANYEHFISYLTHFNKEYNGYYGISGCRGCRYTRQQIEKNINIALKSAIDYCMYTKKENIYEYKGDSLEQEFVNACDKFGINIGTPVNI